MKFYAFIFVFLNFSTQALASELCPAPNLQRFLVEQSSPANEVGMFAAFDFSDKSECFGIKGQCEQRKFVDHGRPGYYEEHMVYVVLYNQRVIFASTSRYSDDTYGSWIGSDGAETDWSAAFRKLLSKTVCL